MDVRDFNEDGSIILLSGKIDFKHPIEDGQSVKFNYGTQINGKHVSGETFVNNTGKAVTVGSLLEAQGFEIEESTNEAEINIDDAADVIAPEGNVEESSMDVRDFNEDGSIILLSGKIDFNYSIEAGKSVMFNYGTQVNGEHVSGKVFLNDSGEAVTVGSLLEAKGFEIEESTNEADIDVDDAADVIAPEDNVINNISHNVRTILKGEISGEDMIVRVGEEVIIKEGVTINGVPISVEEGKDEVSITNDTYFPQKLSIGTDGIVSSAPVDIPKDLMNEHDSNHHESGDGLGFAGEPNNDDGGSIDLHGGDVE